MNTDHIKIFIEVYRAKSFAAVAEHRNVAPSSISRSVGALESALKIRLFHRTTRSLMPTDEGRAYFQQIASIMEAFDHAHESISSSTKGPSGRLRVSASVSFGQLVIAPRIQLFREQYPDIELDLMLSDSRVDIVSERIDVAIRHGRLPDSSLTARKLATVRYRLVASPTYLQANSEIKHPEDLADHDLVAFSYDDFRYEWTFQCKDLLHVQSVMPVVTLSNAAAIRQCVLDGVGIALLADWTLEGDLASNRLVELLPKWKVSGASENPSIWIVYPSNKFVPVKTRAFTDFMSSQCRLR